jgi:hypothetical protein
LANLAQTASMGRGLPLFMPPFPAGNAHPGAPAEAAAHIDILPLSMVAVSGPPTGAAATLSSGRR